MLSFLPVINVTIINIEIQRAFCIYSLFQSGPATFQAPHHHMWLVTSEYVQIEYCSIYWSIYFFFGFPDLNNVILKLSLSILFSPNPAFYR